jgi:hypothetical protein
MVDGLGMVPRYCGGDRREMSKPKKQKPVRRNPHARELAQAKYRQRVVEVKRHREQKPVKIDEIEAETA